jgi:hypothetical protein
MDAPALAVTHKVNSFCRDFLFCRDKLAQIEIRSICAGACKRASAERGERGMSAAAPDRKRLGILLAYHPQVSLWSSALARQRFPCPAAGACSHPRV